VTAEETDRLTQKAKLRTRTAQSVYWLRLGEAIPEWASDFSLLQNVQTGSKAAGAWGRQLTSIQCCTVTPPWNGQGQLNLLPRQQPRLQTTYYIRKHSFNTSRTPSDPLTSFHTIFTPFPSYFARYSHNTVASASLRTREAIQYDLLGKISPEGLCPATGCWNIRVTPKIASPDAPHPPFGTD
jgi:hypothetical protein